MTRLRLNSSLIRRALQFSAGRHMFQVAAVCPGICHAAVHVPEEAVAFVLAYAKQIAERHAGSAIKDAVITIPPFFGHLERQAVLSAVPHGVGT